MTSIAAIVSQALTAAGIPIEGVSIGTEADRSTWTVQFQPAATPQQRTDAAALLLTVRVDADAQFAEEKRILLAQADALPLLFKALVLTLNDQLNTLRANPATPFAVMTTADMVAAIKAKCGTLTRS